MRKLALGGMRKLVPAWTRDTDVTQELLTSLFMICRMLEQTCIEVRSTGSVEGWENAL